VEDRISEFEDKVDKIAKTNEYIDKGMKKYKRNVQEIFDFIKMPNLQIMAYEGEGV
jgi:hypothetical protein